MPGVSAGAGTAVSVGVVGTTYGGGFQYDAIYYTSVGMQYDAGGVGAGARVVACAGAAAADCTVEHCW